VSDFEDEKLILYRAAQAERPYLGLGSHWTPNERHAHRFKALLEQHERAFKAQLKEGRLGRFKPLLVHVQERLRGPFSVYRAKVNPTGAMWRRGVTGPFEGELWIEYEYWAVSRFWPS
jgi:hypothetical protein